MPDGLYYHITLSSALTSYSLLNSVKIFRLSTSKLFTEPSNVILGLHFRVWQVASRLANQPLAQAPSHHSHHRTHPLRSSPWHVTTLCTALLKIPLLIISMELPTKIIRVWGIVGTLYYLPSLNLQPTNIFGDEKNRNEMDIRVRPQANDTIRPWTRRVVVYHGKRGSLVRNLVDEVTLIKLQKLGHCLEYIVSYSLGFLFVLIHNIPERFWMFGPMGKIPLIFWLQYEMQLIDQSKISSLVITWSFSIVFQLAPAIYQVAAIWLAKSLPWHIHHSIHQGGFYSIVSKLDYAHRLLQITNEQLLHEAE